MWTKTQIRAHQVALATAKKLKGPLRKLAEMAKFAPAFEGRVAELQTMRDMIESMAKAAVAADPEGDE